MKNHSATDKPEILNHDVEALKTVQEGDSGGTNVQKVFSKVAPETLKSALKRVRNNRVNDRLLDGYGGDVPTKPQGLQCLWIFLGSLFVGSILISFLIFDDNKVSESNSMKRNNNNTSSRFVDAVTNSTSKLTASEWGWSGYGGYGGNYNHGGYNGYNYNNNRRRWTSSDSWSSSRSSSRSRSSYYQRYYESCFPAGEKVETLLMNGEIYHSTPIEDLRPGAIVKAGGRVSSVIKLLWDTDNERLYRYNNSVCVTGSHSIPAKDGSLQLVQDSVLATLAPDCSLNKHTKFLYNLVTENHRIVINGTILADWEETEPVKDLQTLQDVLDRLNKDSVAVGMIKNNRKKADIARHLTSSVEEGGLSNDTMVKLNDMNHIPISNLEPGDVLHNGVVVIAVVHTLLKKCDLWIHDNNLIGGAWTILKDLDGVWRPLKESPWAKHLTEQSEECLLYHIITNTHQYQAGRVVLVDFEVF